MNDPLRIGSRRSRLAMVQSAHVRDVIERRAGVRCEIVGIDTRGDLDRSSPLPEVGGKGLFTRELEERLHGGDIDIAVHSLKDLPGELPDGLALGAITAREDPRDVLVGAALDALAPGARVGTGSVRRAAQIRHLRSDVVTVDIRGNVPTRLEKLDRGDYDAVVLAAAGLRRLGLGERITEAFPVDRVVPACGQGALGIECRSDDAEVLDLLARTVACPVTTRCGRAERRVQAALAAGCNAPLGIHAAEHDGRITIDVFVADGAGRASIRERIEGPAAEADALADALVERLRRRGADRLLAEARRDVP